MTHLKWALPEGSTQAGSEPLKDAVFHSLQALPREAPPAHRGYLSYVASYATGLTGDYPAAIRHVEEALELLQRESFDDQVLLVAAARLVRGTVRMALGHSDDVDADMNYAVDVGRREACAWILG